MPFLTMFVDIYEMKKDLKRWFGAIYTFQEGWGWTKQPSAAINLTGARVVDQS